MECCVRHGLIHQAYTLARELIVTLLCARFEISSNIRRDRESVEWHINASEQRNRPGSRVTETGEGSQQFLKCKLPSEEIFGFLDRNKSLSA